MKKVLFVAFMVMAFMAMASMAAFACGGDKAEKASAKTASACSADKTTEAKLASSKTTGDKAACTAAEKAACASKASMVNAEGKAACASKASLANAEGKSCTIAMCVEKSAAAHAELCGEKAATHHLTAMSIKGMTCGGCEGSVKTALMAVEGVTNVVEVCHKAGFAVVCTDKADFNNEVLVKTVTAKGYESEIIPAVAVTTTDSKSEKAECSAKKTEGSN